MSEEELKVIQKYYSRLNAKNSVSEKGEAIDDKTAG
jgi:hypothetical protein